MHRRIPSSPPCRVRRATLDRHDEYNLLLPLAVRPYRSLLLPAAPVITAHPRLAPVAVERRALASYAALVEVG